MLIWIYVAGFLLTMFVLPLIMAANYEIFERDKWTGRTKFALLSVSALWFLLPIVVVASFLLTLSETLQQAFRGRSGTQ